MFVIRRTSNTVTRQFSAKKCQVPILDVGLEWGIKVRVIGLYRSAYATQLNCRRQLSRVGVVGVKLIL